MKNKIVNLFIFIVNAVKMAFKPMSTGVENWSVFSRKRSTEEGNLEGAIEKATDLQHLEENIESLEDYESAANDFDESSFDESFSDDFDDMLEGESVENLTRARQRRIAKRMARKRGRRGGIFAAKRMGMTGSMANIAGQLTVNIVRLTYNISQDLPVQIFNPLDGFCNSPLVKKYLPANVQLISGYADNTATNFNFVFRDTNTNAIDTVVVSCNEVAYVKMMYGLTTDRFTVSGGTVKISDETKTVQFDKKFTFSDQNILGKSEDNPLNMGSFIRPDNFRKDIANILIKFPVNKEKGFIFNCAYISSYVGTGTQLTTTFFLNLNNIKLHK